jgi:nucleoside-diphosphate-sugar epimerase
MEDGGWKMEDGRWKMEDGRWKMENMSERRYLLVGGAGYFGARLAEALAGEVVVTQRSAAPEREAWALAHGIEMVSYDSTASGLNVAGDFDAIINLASPGAAEAARDPEAAMQRAQRAAEECLILLKAGRAGRLLHFSTFHVYGAGGRAKFAEADELVPIHPYGRSHAACEALVLAHEKTLILRPSNMVGAPAHAALGDQAKLMFLDLCRQAAAGAIRLQNDGLSYRDFLPFEEAISAVKVLLNAPLSGQRIFNLACGQSTRLDAVAQMIQRVAGAESLEFGTGTDAFRAPFEVDVSRLRALGWEPGTSLEDETGRILSFYR